MNLKLSITGDLGSGKSTICAMLRDFHGYEWHSLGGIMRDMAASHGMSISDFNEYAKGRREIDDEIDGRLIEFGKGEGRIILDSRMAWHFVPDTVKLYLTVDPQEAASRVFADDKRTGRAEVYSSVEHARMELRARKQRENDRYFSLYGVDCSNLFNYDLIVDATTATPEEEVAAILDYLNSGETRKRTLLCPKRIKPSDAPAEQALTEEGLLRVRHLGGEFVAVGGMDAIERATRDTKAFVQVSLE